MTRRQQLIAKAIENLSEVIWDLEETLELPNTPTPEEYSDMVFHDATHIFIHLLINKIVYNDKIDDIDPLEL